MSNLVARLRHTKAGYVTAKLDDLVQEAADRIEALEAALMAEWAARDNRIEALEFELKAAKSEIEIADSVIEQKHARIEAPDAMTDVDKVLGELTTNVWNNAIDASAKVAALYDAPKEAVDAILRLKNLPERDQTL